MECRGVPARCKEGGGCRYYIKRGRSGGGVVVWPEIFAPKASINVQHIKDDSIALNNIWYQKIIAIGCVCVPSVHRSIFIYFRVLEDI